MAEREMTLDEWCARLLPSHLVNRQLRELREQIAALSSPAPAQVGKEWVVTDEMVEAAMDAHAEFWNDESRLVECGTCNGEGAIPVGIDADRDYCPTCGGPPGQVFEGDEKDAMRAALTAALAPTPQEQAIREGGND